MPHVKGAPCLVEGMQIGDLHCIMLGFSCAEGIAGASCCWQCFEGHPESAGHLGMGQMQTGFARFQGTTMRYSLMLVTCMLLVSWQEDSMY